jgi:phosphatidylinositol alpha-1,6-mannosyltransferase
VMGRAEMTSGRGQYGVVLALLPSKGLGGGIEGYCQAVMSHLAPYGVVVEDVALLGDGTTAVTARSKVRFAWQAGRVAWRQRYNLRILCFHAGLLPVALLCRCLTGRRAPVQVVCHGNEVWRRSHTFSFLVRHSSTRLIAVSDFTAGALISLQAASIVPPSLSPERRALLQAVGRDRSARRGDILRILTVFRLTDFENKGGAVLLDAVREVRRRGGNVELVVAGRSESHRAALDATFAALPDWGQLIRDPTDAELAQLYDNANLFVSATRLRGGPDPWAEGFGTVLLEAATAGLPVVAPWGGGGHAAVLHGITALRPGDQSVESLSALLGWALDHRAELLLMGANGRMWAEEYFSAEVYGRRVGEVVLGAPADAPLYLGLGLVSSVREDG